MVLNRKELLKFIERPLQPRQRLLGFINPRRQSKSWAANKQIPKKIIWYRINDVSRWTLSFGTKIILSGVPGIGMSLSQQNPQMRLETKCLLCGIQTIKEAESELYRLAKEKKLLNF